MQVALGAKVTTADGKQIGSIDKLILEPESGEIRAVVVRKGLLFPDDIEIDLDGIAGRDDGGVLLRYTEHQLDDLPRFHEGSYTAPPPERTAGYAHEYGYPEATYLWPARGADPVDASPYGREAVGDVADEVRLMHQEQDLSNAVIEEGSEVRGSDDEKVGSVHRVRFDPATRQLAAIVIRQGVLFSEDVELPASLISGAVDGVVYLNVGRDEVKRHAGRQPTHPPVI